MSERDVNQRIHEWLSLPEFHTEHSWRIPEGDMVYKCTNCGKSRGLEGKYCRKVIPARYDTDPAAMLDLIEELRSRGYEDLQMATDTLCGKPHGYYCNIAGGLHDPICDGNAPTLPAAVAKAVIALIESEEKE